MVADGYIDYFKNTTPDPMKLLFTLKDSNSFNVNKVFRLNKFLKLTKDLKFLYFDFFHLFSNIAFL